jgi:hypothetical protein
MTLNPSPKFPRSNSPDAVGLGLCSDCRHAQRIASSKGSQFLLCKFSKIDPSFPKYPPLPVLSCSAHEKKQQ